MNNSSKLFQGLKSLGGIVASRNFSATNKLSDNVFQRIFGVNVAQATQSHSVTLAHEQCLYDLQIHHVKPENVEDYENLCEEYLPTMKEKFPHAELTGSWRTEIGALDQYVHLWKYKNYTEYSDTFNKLTFDDENKQFKKKLCKVIKKRENQVCLSFSFWGEPAPRDESHIYEMRSYSLKPGTLIEWGNNWERGIRNRLDYCVAGMFTQVGPLFKVHHIWAYKSMAERKIAREKMWEKPGWDECVAYTVPLIRTMESKIMAGLPYSAMK